MKNPFNRPLGLKNTIQEYDWGSHTAIQEILGHPKTDVPWAELWLGAHPKAPSRVDFMGQWVGLDALIEQWPFEILGKTIAEKFNHALPFLFKILAAAKPLSIQAHPGQNAAQEGFHRENSLKIPLNAPHRNYKDDRHKPECLCAVTSFWALKGFRDLPAMIRLLDCLCPHTLLHELNKLKSQGASFLKHFFNTLLTLPVSRKANVILEAVENARRHPDDAVFSWVLKLHEAYPSDIGILAPALLNLICLVPGQAVFISSGELHSYLEGVGIELMANSDNVIRGGLTHKHVDADELMRIVTFDPSEPHVLTPQPSSPGEEVFPLKVKEFSLSRITLCPGGRYASCRQRSAEILLCIQGAAAIHVNGGNSRYLLEKGASVLIPAAMAPYEISGHAMIYKASTPLSF